MFTQVLHPTMCRTFHIDKLKLGPLALGNPMGYGRCGESQNGNLHSFALNDGIWRKEGIFSIFIYNVSTNGLRIQVVDIALVGGSAGLDVVVAQHHGIA